MSKDAWYLITNKTQNVHNSSSVYYDMIMIYIYIYTYDIKIKFLLIGLGSDCLFVQHNVIN